MQSPSSCSLPLGHPGQPSQFSSVAQSCPTLRPHRLRHARPPCPIANSRSLLKLMSIQLVMPSNHLILCRSLGSTAPPINRNPAGLDLNPSEIPTAGLAPCFTARTTSSHRE